mmetsp:Transcript_17930/g.25614  ORF Transcript_17930/g.25614 Transcript_17930/m.25614 type:complete len:253 (+) Transcript_17930:402-1160(+)
MKNLWESSLRNNACGKYFERQSAPWVEEAEAMDGKKELNRLLTKFSHSQKEALHCLMPVLQRHRSKALIDIALEIEWTAPPELFDTGITSYEEVKHFLEDFRTELKSLLTKTGCSHEKAWSTLMPKLKEHGHEALRYIASEIVSRKREWTGSPESFYMYITHLLENPAMMSGCIKVNLIGPKEKEVLLSTNPTLPAGLVEINIELPSPKHYGLEEDKEIGNRLISFCVLTQGHMKKDNRVYRKINNNTISRC